jgi:signal transduction histidine kinase
MTKIDAQAFEIKLRNQDIVYVVREITLSVADYIANKGLKLIFHSDVEKKIMAFDEEKIERIILNLLSNAIKFSPLGAAIHVDLSDNGDTILIKVRDKGIGVPPDSQQNIFQRFYQISPMHTRLREGSGIGLNLVKSLVEMHKGTITLESEPGAGTTFIIELPGSVLPEKTTEIDESKSRHSRIENIQLEFSDIYLGNNTYMRAE